MSKKNEYIVGLDIGTTKICCIIGEISHENQVDIIGLGNILHGVYVKVSL